MNFRPPARKLAAVLFTDMVGYAALVQRNEALALTVVKRQQRWVRELLPHFGGREIKTMGDAFLILFDSSLRACECAIALQQKVHAEQKSMPDAERFQIRIGLHLGDIERPDNDVFGDSVNIAARLQTLAPAGGLAVSGLVYEQVRSPLAAPFRARGDTTLKNIAHPVALYVLEAPDIVAMPAITAPPRTARPFRWRSVLWVPAMTLMLAAAFAVFQRWSAGHRVLPSVAVLPFANTSSTPGAEHFVTGVHDTLLAQLAGVSGLKVISRTSVLEYRNASRNLREIGKTLGAGHVVEGSVQRDGDRVRVNVQLIEATSDRNVWGSTYDRTLADVFAIQSDLARNITGAVQAVLTPGESARLSQAPTQNPQAYEHYLRAIAQEHEDRFSAAALNRCQIWLQQALALDPDFALAHAALSRVHTYHFDAGYDVSESRLAQAQAAAVTALRLRPDLAEAHLALGLYFYYGFLDFPRALLEMDRALTQQPNSADAHSYRGFILRRAGRPAEALASLQRAVVLDPRNPATVYELAATHAFLHQNVEADTVCRQWLSRAPETGDFRVHCAIYATRRVGTLQPGRDLEQELSALPKPGPDLHWIRYELALNEGRYSDAHRHLLSLSDDDLLGWAGAPPREMLLGDLARWQGDRARASDHYRRAKAQVVRRLAAYAGQTALVTNQAFARVLLARLHAELGETADAHAEAERARVLLPEELDHFYGVSLAEELAKVDLRLGRHDRALDTLERLLAIPSHTHIHDLRLQRQWSDLWDLPRFKKIVERYASHTP